MACEKCDPLAFHPFTVVRLARQSTSDFRREVQKRGIRLARARSATYPTNDQWFDAQRDVIAAFKASHAALTHRVAA